MSALITIQRIWNRESVYKRDKGLFESMGGKPYFLGSQLIRSRIALTVNFKFSQ